VGSPKVPYRHPSAEWLREKYETERLDCVQIAALFGCDPKTAWEWIKAAGIETRKRGYGQPANHFKRGQRSVFAGHKHSPTSLAKIEQATRARGGVPYLKNGVHWLKHPGAVNGRWLGGITPERQTFYRSPEWKEAVKAVWKRDNGICQRCALDYRTIQRSALSRFHIHHIDSFAIAARRTLLENLILVCRECHLWIHSKDNPAHLFLGIGHDFDPAPFWRKSNFPTENSPKGIDRRGG
jgi:HNH endonuclease